MPGSEIEKRCDLILNHTEKGLVLWKRLNLNEETATPGNEKRRNKQTTSSIHQLLEETKERERERANKVSAKLSVMIILPDEWTHNTRHTTPLRQRHNMRDQQASYANKNYSDNLDIHHLDSPPNKRSKKHNVPKTLREPSQTRISAQEMMKIGEVQHSLSPLANRKLIGTAIKEEKDEKPKVKTDKDIDLTVITR